MASVTQPRQIFRPHPLLGWGLTPNKKVTVPFRCKIEQTIDEDGWRLIPGKNADAQRMTLAVYGCSFTYGTGLADDETYTALLQASSSRINILNRGVGGHGNVQGYLQFRKDVKDGKVQAAIFGVISDHRYRNIAHPVRMKAHLAPFWYDLGVEHLPRVRFNRTGQLLIEYVPIWQPSLFRDDFQVFLPDEYTIDRATIKLIAEIICFAKQHKSPILIALLDQIDPEFNKLMRNEFAEVVDISTPYTSEYTFLPDDIHPNVLANRLFAERLFPWVNALVP